MAIIHSTAVIALLATCALCRMTPVPQLPTGCYHDGKMYQIHEHVNMSPCEPCQCTPSGSFACAIIDCAFGMCADAVHKPDQCCPTCPNGHTCMHKDGTIIKEGDTYQPDPNTNCTCPPYHGFGSSMAQCIHSIP